MNVASENMESEKYRRITIMSWRAIARFSPMLENNSRNILASAEPKGENNLSRNLRVTWLFRKWDHSWNSKRGGARNTELFPGITTTLRGYSAGWNGVGRGEWVISRGKVRETRGNLNWDLARTSPTNLRTLLLGRGRAPHRSRHMCVMISNKVSTLRFDCHPTDKSFAKDKAKLEKKKRKKNNGRCVFLFEKTENNFHCKLY